MASAHAVAHAGCEVRGISMPPTQRRRGDVGQHPSCEAGPQLQRQVGGPEGEGDPPSVEADATVARPQLQLGAEQPAEIVEQVAANGRVQPVTAQVDALPVHGDRRGQPADAVRPIEDPDREAPSRRVPRRGESGGPGPDHCDVDRIRTLNCAVCHV